jgi:hypothetical protein
MSDTQSESGPGRITDIKRCSRCKEHKAREAFANSPVTRDGKQNWCRQCHKDHRLAKIAERATA